MELSKKSFAMLCGISAMASAACLTAVGLLGNSVKDFWKFDANREEAEQGIAELQAQRQNSVRSLAQAEADRTNRLAQITTEIEGSKTILGAMSARLGEFVALTNQLERERYELKNIQDLAANTKKDKAALEGQLESVKVDLKAATEKLAALQAEQARLVADSTRLQTAQADLQTCQTAIKEAQGKIAELKSQIDDVGKSKETLEKVVLTRRDELHNAEAENGRLEERIKGLTNTLMAIEGQITIQKATLADLGSQIKAKSKTDRDLDQSIAVRQPTYDAIMKRVAMAAGEYIAATNQLEDAKIRLKQIQTEADTAAAVRKRESEEEIAEARRKLAQDEETSRKAVQEAVAQRDAANTNRAAVLVEIASLGARKDGLQGAITELEGRSKNLDGRLATKAAELKSIEAQVAASKQELTANEGKIRAQQKTLTDTEAEIKKLEVTVQSLSSAVTARHGELQALATEVIHATTSTNSAVQNKDGK